MTEDASTRRRLLSAAGLAVVAGFAGCIGRGLVGQSPADSTETTDRTTETTTSTTGATTTGATTTGTNTTGTDSTGTNTTGTDSTGTNTTGTTTNGTTTNGTTTAEPKPTPHGVGEAHLHGTFVVTIDGERYHFDRPRYMEEQSGNPYFHFHTDGHPDRWHVHAKGVTLGYAADSLAGFDLAADSVTVDGRTYDDADPGTSVAVTVNGSAVDPRTYVLRGGDVVTVVVETGGSSGGTAGNGTW